MPQIHVPPTHTPSPCGSWISAWGVPTSTNSVPPSVFFRGSVAAESPRPRQRRPACKANGGDKERNMRGPKLPDATGDITEGQRKMRVQKVGGRDVGGWKNAAGRTSQNAHGRGNRARLSLQAKEPRPPGRGHRELVCLGESMEGTGAPNKQIQSPPNRCWH
jgi:hypothetical protein